MIPINLQKKMEKCMKLVNKNNRARAKKILWGPRSWISRFLFEESVTDCGAWCLECSSYIDIYSEWVCPHCGVVNKNIHAKCEECNEVPSSYVCPHCGAKIDIDAGGTCSKDAVVLCNFPRKVRGSS